MTPTPEEPMTAAARKPDQLIVPGKVQWTFTRAGLVSAVLAGRTVLSGGTAPINSDNLFDANDAADKVGELSGAYIAIDQKHNACTVTQNYQSVVVQQTWQADGEDATCRFSFTNYGPTVIRYPALGGLTASWPAQPDAGIATSSHFNHWYTQACGRAALTPGASNPLRVRASYLAGGGVGVSICPLDLGDEKNLILWEATYDAPYTSRWFRVIWDRPIGPGESRTFRLTLRVSDDVDFKHLLEPYKGK